MLASDLSRAERRVVIYSPFMTENRLSQVGPQLAAATERGVAVYVITKPLAERGKRELARTRDLEQALDLWGVVVVHKRGMHEKLVFVDDQIVWSGSLNALSYRDTQEVMERRRSKVVSEQYSQTIRLDDLVGGYEEGALECPICCSEMVASDGRSDPFYWRCIEKDCYTRGIDEPALIGGKITCRNCGSDVEFGHWGD